MLKNPAAIQKKMAEKYDPAENASLLDHLEAFRWTLLWCVAAIGVFAVPGIIFIPELLLKYVRCVCPPGMEMHYFTPFEPLMVQLELGFLTGVVAALPLILFKLGEFAAPGLYRHERRWGLFFLISSVLLIICGITVALAAVVPIVMRFSWSFSAEGLKPVIGLSAFLHFSGMLAAGFALIFELPVALLLAIRMGIISVDTLRKKRPFIVVTLFVVAALMTPPDVVSQLLMGMPGWILFELTLLIGSRIAPEKEEEIESFEYRDPVSTPAEEEEKTLPLSDETPVSAPPEINETYIDPYRSAARKKRRIRHL